jgi:hypothetical protein
MSEPTAEDAPVRRPSRTIPPLRNLIFEECGFSVPATFTADFVRLHSHDWPLAERDWVNIVAKVLDTDAVHPRAKGAGAIKQAVEAAAQFLFDGAFWPWCPICKKGTEVEGKEDDDD